MSAIFSVPITFNGVSVGKEKVSVGIGIDHARVTREQMGEMFVNRQLDCELVTGEPGAQSLPGIDSDRVEITATFTARSYSEKKDGFGTRLTVTKSEIDPSDLWDVAGRSGHLTVRQSRAADNEGGGALPGQMEFDAEDLEVDEADEEPAPTPVEAESEDGEPIGDLEEIVIPIPEKAKHRASVYVQEFATGWTGGWDWEGDQGGGDNNNGPAIFRRSREDAITAAAGQLVDSLQKAKCLPSKAAGDRRAAAVKAAQTFYSDAERGGATVFETHSA